MKYEWNPGWQRTDEDHGRAALLSSALILHRPASRSAAISSIPQRGPVWQEGLTGSGNTEDAPVKAAGFSHPNTLPTIQACGAGQASKPTLLSTTIFPHQEGQEVLLLTAKGCSHPLFLLSCLLYPAYQLDKCLKRTSQFLSSPTSSFSFVTAKSDCGT